MIRKSGRAARTSRSVRRAWATRSLSGFAATNWASESTAKRQGAPSTVPSRSTTRSVRFGSGGACTSGGTRATRSSITTSLRYCLAGVGLGHVEPAHPHRVLHARRYGELDVAPAGPVQVRAAQHELGVLRVVQVQAGPLAGAVGLDPHAERLRLAGYVDPGRRVGVRGPGAGGLAEVVRHPQPGAGVPLGRGDRTGGAGLAELPRRGVVEPGHRHVGEPDGHRQDRAVVADPRGDQRRAGLARAP